MRELAPAEVAGWLGRGADFIDIRSAAERASGMPGGARALREGEFEGESVQLKGNAVVLICARGQRSLALGTRLAEAGLEVASVRGGLQVWRQAGLGVSAPDALAARYARQLVLPEVGLAGQARLQQACVAIVGAGGLGAPAAFYLAAAGVGRLRLIDTDVVERSNLHRQIVHVDAAVGIQKVESARARLLALNPDIAVEAVAMRLDAGNARTLLAGADVVLDATDDDATRVVLNAASIALRIPLVYGAVLQFQGQVSVFDAGRQPGVAPCYACLFPETGVGARSCAEAGVLGVVPGVIGSLQATEALKLLLKTGEPLIGRVLSYDALAMQFRTTRLTPDPGCDVCGAR